MSEAPVIARQLLAAGPAAVILKLGDQGCVYVDRATVIHSPAYRIEPVDATAAGDTFNAGLAVALTEGRGMEEALAFANAAAAISVTRSGAQASIPTRAEVDAFLTSYTV